MYSSRRLRKEYQAICKSPIDYVKAHPLESNILDWHFVIIGVAGTPYEGGYYHGLLKFPQEYPLKPPSIIMCTPTGRFGIGRRICMSMSDFHPESWNPMWSVSTILIGLQSFMMDNTPAAGTVSSSIAEKRKLARNSLAFNCRNKLFIQLFPELVELHQKAQGEEATVAAVAATSAIQGDRSSKDNGRAHQLLLRNGNATATTTTIVKDGHNNKENVNIPPPRDIVVEVGESIGFRLMLFMTIATILLLAVVFMTSFT